MPLIIKVDDSTNQERLITLNGKSIFLTVRFNTMDYNWYMDISDRNKVAIKSGIKILPKSNLTGKYVDVSALLGGIITCVSIKPTNKALIDRDNLGTNAQYQLWYWIQKEIDSL